MPKLLDSERHRADVGAALGAGLRYAGPPANALMAKRRGERPTSTSDRPWSRFVSSIYDRVPPAERVPKPKPPAKK